MNTIPRIVTKSLCVIVSLLVAVMSPSKEAVEAKHWPDFSCHAHKETVRQQNAFKHNRMAWNSCKQSHESYKQECAKMCALRNGKVIKKSKREEPFRFYTEAFITFMLKELGYQNEHIGEAPQELVKNVTADLDVCKTKHREFENMTNVRYLPCEPYNPLFKCIEDAVGCNKHEPV